MKHLTINRFAIAVWRIILVWTFRSKLIVWFLVTFCSLSTELTGLQLFNSRRPRISDGRFECVTLKWFYQNKIENHGEFFFLFSRVIYSLFSCRSIGNCLSLSTISTYDIISTERISNYNWIIVLRMHINHRWVDHIIQ